MQSKRKKFWVIFSIVCTCVLAVIVVLSLVFRLKTVDVEIRYRLEQGQSELPDQVQDKVLSSGEFAIGQNMFFYNTDNNVKKIEKNIPFVKVEQVIRYFPSTIRVYISERVMKYRVHDLNNPNTMYIVDEDFKILKTIYLNDFQNDEFENSKYYKNTFEVDKSLLALNGGAEGDFITGVDNTKNVLNAVTAGVYGRTKDIGKALSVAGAFNEKDELQISLTMKYKNISIVTTGIDDLTEKIWTGVSLIYSEDMLENTELQENEKIYVEKDFEGKIIARRSSQTENE